MNTPCKKEFKVLDDTQLSPPRTPGHHSGRELDLRALCDFDGRTLESVVPILVESTTLEEFVGRAGYSLHFTEDDSVVKTVFSGKRPMGMDGVEIRDARASVSLHGWYLLANDQVWLNKTCLAEWKREFSQVKAGVDHDSKGVTA